MQKRDLYLIILIFGAVFVFLALVISDSREEAVTIAFLTIFAIFLLRLADEYVYFRSSRAAYATGLFVFIPGGIAIGASMVAAISPWLADNLLEGRVDLVIIRPGEYEFFINSFAIIFALPFYVISAYVLLHYAQRRYPTAYFFRKRLPGRFASWIYSITLISAIISCWLFYSIIELSSAMFITSLMTILLYYHIWEPFRSSIQWSSPSTRSRSVLRSQVTPMRSRTVRPGTNVRTSAAAVSPGINLVNPSGNSTRVETVAGRRVATHPVPSRQERSLASQTQKRINLGEILPAGRIFSEEDFRCIFCYEFPKKSDMVVICPYCKRPSHLEEFRMWQISSPLCSRCNQDLRRKKPMSMSGIEYHMLLKTVKEKRGI